MSEWAAVFPGQGSQVVGMGKDLAEAYAVVRETFAEADEVLGFPLSQLCFAGPEDELTRTVNTQPALLTVSVAIYRLLAREGFRPVAACGHSLGEYSALVAAGALEFADALRTVRLRGKLMEEAVAPGVGTMAAILGLSDEDVVKICREVGGVEPATYNAPGQVVIAGLVEAVERAMELAKARGARRAQRLNVSGPFHSSLLADAGRRLAEWLADVPVKPPAIPVWANVSATATSDPEQIRRNLAEQVSAPVRWVECVHAMRQWGVASFVEVGPGRVLSGLIKRIDRDAVVENVDSAATFERFVREITQAG